MTNGERIRNMTDEELATVFSAAIVSATEEDTKISLERKLEKTKEIYLTWLKEGCKF